MEKKKKQPRRPIAGLLLLEFSPALETWSDPIFTQVLLALSFRRRFPRLFFICYLYLSVTQLGCSLNYISSISWVDMPLTADWLHVYFGTRPRLSFLKRFLKMSYPTFKCTSCAFILYTVSSCNLAWLNPQVHSLITCKTLLITLKLHNITQA